MVLESKMVKVPGSAKCRSMGLDDVSSCRARFGRGAAEGLRCFASDSRNRQYVVTMKIVGKYRRGMKGVERQGCMIGKGKMVLLGSSLLCLRRQIPVV